MLAYYRIFLGARRVLQHAKPNTVTVLGPVDYLSLSHSQIFKTLIGGKKFCTSSKFYTRQQLSQTFSRGTLSYQATSRDSLEAARAEYELTFTCKPCQARSTHRISKQGYQYGSVLVTCPGCKNKHIISDNLKIFGDKKITVENLLREQGQFVKKGTVCEDGTVEIWDSGQG